MQFLVHSLSFSSVYYYGEVHSLIFECWTVCVLVKIMHGPWCAEAGLYELMRAHLIPTYSNILFQLHIQGPYVGPWTCQLVMVGDLHHGNPYKEGFPHQLGSQFTSATQLCYLYIIEFGLLVFCSFVPVHEGRFVLFCFYNIFWHYLAS